MKPGKMLLIFVALLTLVGMACNTLTQGIHIGTGDLVGSGPLTTQTLAVRDFNAIVLETSGIVTVEQGDAEFVQIEAPDDVMDHLVTEVRSGKLYLGIDPGTNLGMNRRIKYLVSVRSLEEIQLLGSGSFSVPSIAPPQFVIRLGGSGDIAVDRLDTSRLEVDIYGSGSVDIRDGQVSDQVIRIAGSGSCDTSNVESQSAQVSIPGSGDVTVWATEELDVTIDGSGNISYYGEPAVINQSIRGSGGIRQLGNK